MPEEFEGDLAGAVFWGADLSGARFRDVNLTDAKISHAWLVNVEIDAMIDTVVINGVDVTAYVNERDPWYPLRGMLRPPDPEGMRSAWAALEAEWAKTVTRALALPETRLDESVNGEWSFVQTLRHLVMAMDKWFTVPVLGGTLPPDRVAEHRLRRLPVARPRSRPDAVGLGSPRGARGSRHALSGLSRHGCADRSHPTGRRARERPAPLARVHLHRVRGRVLAQPLRRAATSRTWKRRPERRLGSSVVIVQAIGDRERVRMAIEVRW